MSSKQDYRANAEDCLRKAQTAENEEEKPFWLNLAQSWLQLAQYSTQKRAEADTNKPISAQM
jgi:putative IMPACT (imprinted ancient) family translation regulator